jgi:hypothetical protein
MYDTAGPKTIDFDGETPMARMQDWQVEAQEARRKEMWTLRGPTQVVKVVPLPPAGTKPDTEKGGYITLGIFLNGKTPQQIERALGLKIGYLASGARVYRFARLPQPSEYEYELTTQYPGGLAFNPAYSDPKYPPGSRVIHQWRIKDGVKIPVDAANVLDLHPADAFPYSWLVKR